MDKKPYEKYRVKAIRSQKHPYFWSAEASRVDENGKETGIEQGGFDTALQAIVAVTEALLDRGN